MKPTTKANKIKRNVNLKTDNKEYIYKHDKEDKIRKNVNPNPKSEIKNIRENITKVKKIVVKKTMTAEECEKNENISIDLDEFERHMTKEIPESRKNYYKPKPVIVDIEYDKLDFNYPKLEKYTVTPYEKIQSRPVADYNTYALRKLNKIDKVRTILITCNTFAENAYIEAWGEAISEREDIVKYISKKWQKNIKIVVSTIEHHHTLNKKLKEKLENKYVRSEDEESGSEEYDDDDDDDDGKKKKRSTLSIYDIYMSKTTEMYLSKLDMLKQDTSVLYDMTNEQMVVTYYNILQTLRYLNGESGRKSSMIKYIKEEQEYYVEDMMKIKQCRYKGEVNFSYRKLAIISHHKRIGNNLLGYPHLHIAVLYTGIINPEKFRNEIHEYVMEKGMFDVKVDRTITREAEEEGNGITYVMKNHKNKYVNDKINEYQYKKSVVQMHINSIDSRYIEYAKGFVERGDKPHYQPIHMDVYLRNNKECENVEECINNITLNVQQIDNEKDDYNRLLSFFLSVMLNEKNNFVLCNGSVYKKVPGSKMTYKPHKTIESFVGTIGSVEPINKIATKWKQEIIALMKITDIEEKLTEETDFAEFSENYRPRFPRITIDYRMIEYADFFFNTLTTKIYKNQNKYYCYYYAKHHSLANLKSNLKIFEEKSQWNEILKNNELDTSVVYALLFELLRPKNVKGLTPVLYGGSNAGKSTLFTPFRNYYPKTHVSSLDTKLTGHYVADLIKSKELVIVEEGNKLLNDADSSTILLKALAGEHIIADKKLGKVDELQTGARIVMAINVKETDDFMDTIALVNRLYFIGYMKTLKNLKLVKDSIVGDEPLIYIYCGLEFMRLSKPEYSSDDFFEIIEELGEEEDNEIMKIKHYYGVEGVDTPTVNVSNSPYELVNVDASEIGNDYVNNMINADSQRKFKYDTTRPLEAEKLKDAYLNQWYH